MGLNEKQRAFLDEVRFGAVATIDPGGMPHQTVMWYLVHGDEVMFNTTRERKKARDLERDPRVSMLVADGYRFVRVTGRARETAGGTQGLEDILRLAVRYGGPDEAERQRPHFARDDRVTFRFKIGRVYASADLR